MENKQNEKNLNTRIWRGKQELLNVENADAVVCITVTHNEDGTTMNSHIEGSFTGGDYMQIFELLCDMIGREHLMIFMMVDSAKELSRRIMGGNDDKNEPEADGGDGAGTDRH